MRFVGRYDTELQMFWEPPRVPTRAHLGFLRWLAEHGRLEHETAGAPSGQYVHDEAERQARNQAA